MKYVRKIRQKRYQIINSPHSRKFFHLIRFYITVETIQTKSSKQPDQGTNQYCTF